jgi:hypothetical protein
VPPYEDWRADFIARIEQPSLFFPETLATDCVPNKSQWNDMERRAIVAFLRALPTQPRPLTGTGP